MKVNFEKIKEINLSCIQGSDTLPCYWLIQQGIERYLYANHEPLSEQHKNFLIEMGVLEETQEESKKIVEPFNFMGNDRSKNS